MRETRQEQMQDSGQLSMKESWGIWSYRRPTNTPIYKSLYESDLVSAILENDSINNLSDSNSVEIINLKMPGFL